MKCLKCNTKNNEDAKFCVNCGNELESDKTEDVSSTDETKVIPNNYETNNTVKQDDKKWLKIGLPIAIVIIILIAIFGKGNGGGGFVASDARTKFGDYLVSNGFTRNSSTNYTKYTSNGYLTTIDFNKAVMSLENSSTYSAYYYKSDEFGVAATSGDIKIVVEYDYSTYNYSCTTTPSTYQSYACSYVKSSFVELANTAKKTFNSLTNAAGVSSWDL